MTPLDLLEALKAYCEEITKDMRLLARVQKNSTQTAERSPEVFVGNLPDKESEKKAVPYILLKLLTGKDDNEESIRKRDTAAGGNAKDADRKRRAYMVS